MLGEVLVGVLKHDESHSLVSRLLQESGEESSVNSTESLSLHDLIDTVEHVLILGFSGQLIVDQLCLKSLLRGDDKDGLGGSGGETAHEVVHLALLMEDVGLHVGVSSESHVVLGHGEEEEGAIPSVESEHSLFSESIFNAVDRSPLVDLGVELHDGLSVLRGEGDRNFDSSGKST